MALASDLTDSDPLVATAEESFRLIEEFRVGLAAIDPMRSDRESFGGSLELLSSEIRADTGHELFDAILGPRLHFGGVFADEGLSWAYAGFTWTAHVTKDIFLEAALGGAINDDGKGGRLGCSASFREAAAIGYEMTDHVSLLVGIEHLSHADLCGDYNPGITNVTAKLGYRF